MGRSGSDDGFSSVFIRAGAGVANSSFGRMLAWHAQGHGFSPVEVVKACDPMIPAHQR